MKVGALVRINDLCANNNLVGTLGTVTEICNKNRWGPWPLASVLTIEGIVRFREDTPQLEVISESRPR